MIEIVPDYLCEWRLADKKDVQVVTTINASCNTDMSNFNASSGLETPDNVKGVVRSVLSVKGGQNERRNV